MVLILLGALRTTAARRSANHASTLVARLFLPAVQQHGPENRLEGVRQNRVAPAAAALALTGAQQDRVAQFDFPATEASSSPRTTRHACG